MDWEQIVIYAVPILAGVGVIWSRFSWVLDFAALVGEAAKQTGDVLMTATQAMEDKEISKEEMKAIKKEWLEAASAWKAVASYFKRKK